MVLGIILNWLNIILIFRGGEENCLGSGPVRECVVVIQRGWPILVEFYTGATVLTVNFPKLALNLAFWILSLWIILSLVRWGKMQSAKRKVQNRN